MRLLVVLLILVGQLFLLAFLVLKLREAGWYIYLILEFIGLVEIFFLLDNYRNSSYKITWIIIILAMPIFGIILYSLWGRTGTYGYKAKRIRKLNEKAKKYLNSDKSILELLSKKIPYNLKISNYLINEGFPLFINTQCKYYPLGELQFEDLLKDLRNAEKFIFLEYFIISEGVLWDKIFEILKEKAASGVEVRVLYDDFGSIITLPNNFKQQLKGENIKIKAFSPVHRYISRLYINFRNHQKIAIIDGNIGYTGGTNLADEYANLYDKHGHWKDSAIRLYGDAVWSLTVTFLKMWDLEIETTQVAEDYNLYRPNVKIKGEGFFQPFDDGPYNSPYYPAESMYYQLISNANDYVYITTPYLIIDDKFTNILCVAAKGGVDVRIITPKIWDKWYVHKVTRSNYIKLIEHGVRIYEYTPGYIHAKTIISDDVHAIVGSINMDYRSFYLHFENGVYICGDTVLFDIKKDIIDTINISEEIHLADMKKRSWLELFIEKLLRLFAPML